MIDLKPFCLPEAIGAADTVLLAPWTDGDWTYATNRKIIIRVPRRPPGADWRNAETAVRPPNGAKLFEQHYPAKLETGWIAVPPGAGPQKAKCEKCGGDGRHKCDCGHQHDCVACGGTGHAILRSKTDIGNRRVYDALLALLCPLDNVQVNPSVGGPEDILPFRAKEDGRPVEGLLMPMLRAGGAQF